MCWQMPGAVQLLPDRRADLELRRRVGAARLPAEGHGATDRPRL